MNKKLEVILTKNEKTLEEIKIVREKIAKLEADMFYLRNEILIAPCKYCKYDGVYRCEACQEDDYIGFGKQEDIN